MGSVNKEQHFVEEVGLFFEQRGVLPIRFEPPNAGQKAFEVIGELVPRHRAGAVIVVDDLRLAVACQQ